jgi:hypothetical protein
MCDPLMCLANPDVCNPMVMVFMYMMSISVFLLYHNLIVSGFFHLTTILTLLCMHIFAHSLWEVTFTSQHYKFDLLCMHIFAYSLGGR